MALVMVAVVAMLVVAPAASATKYIDSFFGNPTTSPGVTGGLFNLNDGIGARDSTGDVYVADRTNNRVQQFNATGSFVRAWGRDVVSSGPGQADERQMVTVNATAGTYTLTFSAQTTAPIAFDATASALQTALEDLSNLNPGDVSVSGGPGSSGGLAPYVVQFSGAQANINVTQMTATNVSLTGGTGTAIAVTTVNEGAIGVEVCVAADGDVCKAGVTTGTGFGGELNQPRGIAVDQALGRVFVTEQGRTRVQEFTATGQFVRAWGRDVITNTDTPPNGNGTGFEICDTQHPTTPNAASDCKAGISGNTGGALASTFDGYPSVVPTVPPNPAPNAGNVLIADPGNRRVQEFTPSGAFVRAFGYDVVLPGGAGEQVGPPRNEQ
jgi:hypothetical protein